MYTQPWEGAQGFGPGTMMGWGPEPLLLAIFAFLLPFILVVMFWALVWKGLALWHAARRGQYWWFMILMVVHTLGILEIIYLFFVAKIKFKDLFSTRSGHEHHH